ncbi:MAG: TonB-dependent receptor [Pseudomonadales bacterium]|nr:TonB-dependent receptor [Pseudomonadales bacterium]MDP4640685.1 TonB-dependent receptor [Pseudomonadales bacterium]MDP4765684.1 TonB-dependent receptor [Pseudomonadales bacterium]MDP4875981.1 TonB-dependent receptor [Pseudomonadales bacterium]MDP5059089.1 TonB-dependent receptor [Pseudomonadales bacterium]
MTTLRSTTTHAKAAPGFKRLPLAQGIALVVAAGLGAHASAESRILEEVVVTATKRSESVQDVPLAITALSGQFARAVNLNDVKDLVSFTPGVSGNSQDSFIDAISVRGVRTQDFGVGGDPSAAFFKNDLYEGRNGSAVTSLFDMDRAEILRGPQGFLFGRNSIGGAFSVYTHKAEINDEVDGYLDLDVGQNNHAAFEGAVNIPVNDNMALRLAGYHSEEDGFVDNFFDGSQLISHNKSALRLSGTFIGENLTAHGTAEYEDRQQSGSVYRAIETGDIWDTFEAALGDVNLRGGAQDADIDRSRGDQDNADILSLGLQLDYDFGFATLTSNTGYKDHDYYYTEDYDGTPLNINNYGQDQTGDYLQQEFRLASTSDGMFSWYAGASYYKENIDTLFKFSGAEDFFCQYYGAAYNSGMTFTGCADLYNYYGSAFTPSADGLLTETGRIVGDYSGWGAYVDLNFDVTEQWSLGLGLRYSNDKKDFAINVPTPDSELGPYWAYTFATDGFVSDSKSWNDTQTRAIVRYQPDNDTLFYASYTEGFKSGGFGSFALEDATGAGVGGGTTGASQAGGFRPNAFDPETVDSYEIGYKSTLFDGRTEVNLSGFMYDYQDLQVLVFDGGAAAVKNVGQVDGWGFEGTVRTLLNDNFSLYLAFSSLETDASKLQSICGAADVEACEGSSLFWAPKYTGAGVLDGEFPLASGGAITTSLEVYWESERGGGFENLQETKIDSYADVSLRVGYQSDNDWSVGLYAENLTNAETFDGENNNGGILPSHFFGPKRPRIIGLRYSLDY